ncbi:fungal specific transcription factor domain-containing protein [Sarocladium implicatum]|nr:fungal specific transcription factor domain-containing protein [Sarocladium implicatum]
MGDEVWGLSARVSPESSPLSSSLSMFSEGVSSQMPAGNQGCGISTSDREADSFPVFKSIRQPSAAMLMGGSKKWRLLQAYLLRLSSENAVVRAALFCLEDVLSYELGVQSSDTQQEAHHMSFKEAKVLFISACTSDALDAKRLEELLAALYLLAWVQVIRLKRPDWTEETFPSDQADTIIVDGDCKWNRYSRQLLSCFNSLDAKASHLGGNPVLSTRALKLVSQYPIQITDCGYDDSHQPDSATTFTSPPTSEGSSEGQSEGGKTSARVSSGHTINIKEVVLRAVLQPASEWYLRTQVFFRHISSLDKHRRTRFTPEDEIDVSLRGRQLQSELHDLWEERPSIISLTATELSRTLSPDVAARLHEVFSVYLASYWILFVYLHRVCWWHLAHTDVVRDALAQTWKFFQSSFSERGQLKTVHPALMWPVFVYGSETTCEAQQEWAIEQIKRLALPRPVVEPDSNCVDRLPDLRLSQGVTQNALRAGALLEALIAEQKSSCTRVDIRDLSVKIFGYYFSIV